MASPKILEIVVRARDEADKAFQSSARSAARYGNALGDLSNRHRALEAAGLSLQRSLKEIDDRRAKLRQNIQATPVQDEITQLRQRSVAERARATDPTLAATERREAVQNVVAGRERLLVLEKQLAAEQQKQNASRKRLVELDRERVRVLEQQRRGQSRIDQAAGRGRAHAQRILDQADHRLLERRAAFGDREAAQQLQITNLKRRHRQEAEGLLRITRSQLTTTRQRVLADQKLVDLYRQQAREMQRVRQAGRGAGLRELGRGFLGGASSAGFGPIAGLGAYAGAGGRAAALGVAGAAGGYAAARGLLAASRASREFEFALSRVRAITQATDDDMAKLGKQAEDLGRTTVFTAREAAEAQQAFALAGFKVNQILDATPHALNLAAAGQIELGEAATIVTRIMAGMGIESKNVGVAVDLLTHAFTTANTNISELGTALSYVGPIANTANKELAETVAVLQVLANAGFTDEKGGTAFRQILIKLTNTTGEAQEQLDSLGITLQDDAGHLLNMADIVDQFTEKLGHLGSAERLGVLSTIFEARAAAGFAALMQQGADAIRDYEDASKDAGNTADRVAREQMDNFEGSLTKAKSAVNGLATELGKGLNSELRQFVDLTTEAVNAITDLIKMVEGTGVFQKIDEHIRRAQESVSGGSLPGDESGIASLNPATYYKQQIGLINDLIELWEARNTLQETRKDFWSRWQPPPPPIVDDNPELIAIAERLKQEEAQREERRKTIAAGFESPETFNPLLQQASRRMRSELQQLKDNLAIFERERERQQELVPRGRYDESWSEREKTAYNRVEQIRRAELNLETQIARQLAEQRENLRDMVKDAELLELRRRAAAGSGLAAAELARHNASQPYVSQSRELAKAALNADRGIRERIAAGFAALGAQAAGQAAGDSAASDYRQQADLSIRERIQQLELQALRDRAASSGQPDDELAVRRREIELEFEQRRRDIEQQLQSDDLNAGQRFDFTQLLNQLPQLLQGRLNALDATDPHTGRHDPLDGRLQSSELDRLLGSRGQIDVQRETANNTADVSRKLDRAIEAIRFLGEGLRENQENGSGNTEVPITLAL